MKTYLDEMQYSLIAFDVDGVLLKQKSSWGIIHDYFGVSNGDSLNAFLKGLISYQEFVDRDVALWIRKKGTIRKSEIEKIAQNVEPNPNFQELASFLAEFRGKKIAISGGVDAIVSRVSSFFPIEEIYSNELVFREGKLVGGRAVVDPQNKGKILDRFKGFKVSIGDSEWDIDMFRKSDYSILFNSEHDVDGVDLVIKGNDLGKLAKVLREII
ncbi:MAG: HAD-IB family phosphatase [Thermoplasmatales archaeon]